MAKRKKPMWQRLSDEPALREVVKLVGYAGIACPLSDEASNALAEKYGKEVMKAASEDLLDFDSSKTPTIVKLKPEVLKFCFGILGPSPEQEDEFYRHPDGTPRERPAKVDNEALKNEIEKLDGHDLMARYYKANEILESEPKDSELYRLTKIEFDLIVADCNRAGCHLPKDSSKELADLTKPRLKRKRPAARQNAYQEVTSAVAHGQAAHGQTAPHADQALLQDMAEIFDRALTRSKMPPADRRVVEGLMARVGEMEGVELMQSYFRAKEALEALDKSSPGYPKTHQVFAILEAECRTRGYALPRSMGTPVERAGARPELPTPDRQAAADYARERFPTNLRAMKRQLRALREAYRTATVDSPARHTLKLEIRRLRNTIGRYDTGGAY